MKRQFFIILAMALTLAVAFPSILSAQQGDDYIVINGKLLDKSSKTPIYMASVRLYGSTISNVSNSDGVFSLKVPKELISQNDSIRVSYLGYQTVGFPLIKYTEISNKNVFRINNNVLYSNEQLIIELEPISYPLKAAVVNPTDPESIFNIAFARTKQNYHQKDMAMTGFYREMVKRGNNTYLSLNEAVLDINKVGYRLGFGMDRVGIFKGRGNVTRNTEDSLMLKLQGGPLSSLNVDIVRDPFIGCYLASVKRYYDFKVEKPTMIDNKTFYVLNFNQRDTVSEVMARGKIYIDIESFAIGRIEFNFNVENRDDAYKLFIRKKPSNLRIDVDYATYVVNYTENDGVWYFDYSRIEVKFVTKKRYSLFKKPYTIIAELAITDKEPGEFAIQKENRFKNRDILSSKVSDYTDENFWGAYNIIEPDESIENVIHKIVRQLKRRK